MATPNDVKQKRLKVKEPKKLKVKFVLSGLPSHSQIQDTTMSAGLMKKCNGKNIKKGEHNFPESKPSSVADSDKGGFVESTSTSQEQSKSLSCPNQEGVGDSIKNVAAKLALELEIKRKNSELRQYAEMCMILNDENKRIMDELKLVCQPCVIQMLEAKDPNNNSRTHQEMGLPNIVS